MPRPMEVHSSGCRPYVKPRNSSSSGGQGPIARGVVGSATRHHPIGSAITPNLLSLPSARRTGDSNQNHNRSPLHSQNQNQNRGAGIRTRPPECAATIRESESDSVAAESGTTSSSEPGKKQHHSHTSPPRRGTAQICPARDLLQ